MKKTIYIISIAMALFLGHRFFIYIDTPKDIPEDEKTKKAIVVGASSGMGRAVAKLFAKDGYEVGFVARRMPLLRSLQDEVSTKTYASSIDVSQSDKAKKDLEKLIKKMGGVDVVMVSVSALGCVKGEGGFPKMSWDDEKKFIETDVRGFWTAARVALAQFEKQGYGHLVGMSSIDAIRGHPLGPQYSAAKSFALKYMEGVRNKMILDGKPIFVTTIMPGWVDIEREKYSDLPGTYWVASTQQAAEQIYDAIKKKKKRAYITKRWGLIAWIFSVVPDWLYRRIDG